MNRQRCAALLAGGLLAVAALALTSTGAAAQPAAPAEVAAAIPDARLQGSGVLRVLFFRVYDARLWRGERPVAVAFADTPLAIETLYARDVAGDDITQQTLVELHRQADIDDATATRWLALMRPLFPTVQAGDRLTAVNEPGEGLRLYLNGKPRGRVDDARFARLFFGIWLSPKTSEPALREALLGGGTPSR